MKPNKVTKARKRGFNSLEIVIVIGVVALLMAFVIPNIVRSNVTNNESAALANLYKLAAGFEAYRTLYGSYPDSLSRLINTQPPLVDNKLASGQKQGYNFSLDTAYSGSSFRVYAEPSQPGKTGSRYFKIGSSSAEVNGVAYYALTNTSDTSAWKPIGIEARGFGDYTGDNGDDPGDQVTTTPPPGDDIKQLQLTKTTTPPPQTTTPPPQTTTPPPTTKPPTSTTPPPTTTRPPIIKEKLIDIDETLPPTVQPPTSTTPPPTTTRPPTTVTPHPFVTVVPEIGDDGNPEIPGGSIGTTTPPVIAVPDSVIER